MHVDNEQPPGAVPPYGWEPPREAGADTAAQLFKQLLCAFPEDLRLRLAAALTQLLEALRALIDWLVAWLEHRGGGEVEVRDIPIL